MMVKNIGTKAEHPTRYRDYMDVGDNFAKGAEVAKEFEYWNAAGVLIAHAAIAYSDALTIKHGGVKSRGEDHKNIIYLIEQVIEPTEQDKKSLNYLIKIISEKNRISYCGELYKKSIIDTFWNYLQRYKKWVDSKI